MSWSAVEGWNRPYSKPGAQFMSSTAEEAGSAADKVAVVAGVEHVGRLGPAQLGARKDNIEFEC